MNQKPNFNLSKKNKNFVTYVITAFNKKVHLHEVIKALSREGGNIKKEFILVDDGSSDNSIAIIKNLSNKLPGNLKIVRHKNLGASFSTNKAVKMANSYWIRLLDGDDLVTYKSTEYMLNLAKKNKQDFSYGLINEKPDDTFNFKTEYEMHDKKTGLKKFIKNCPANSSAILVSKIRYCKAGGCNENFISPDQMLFLRLFSKGGGVFLKRVVAITPGGSSKTRLSSQIKRSRYESILALINFCNENPNLEKIFIKLAFKRALSRANTYNKRLNNIYFSSYLFNYILSKFFVPKHYKKLMYNALKVFSGNTCERPNVWKTRAEKICVSNNFIRR